MVTPNPPGYIQPQHPIRMLAMSAVAKMTSLGKSTIHELVAQQQFPAPVKLSSLRTSRFIESEVQAWLQACIEESRAQPLSVNAPAVAKTLNGKEQS